MRLCQKKTQLEGKDLAPAAPSLSSKEKVVMSCSDSYWDERMDVGLVVMSSMELLDLGRAALKLDLCG